MENYEDKINKLLNSISSIENIQLNDIPEIELYMDQITTFIEDKLKCYKRYPTDKILTKTMINNYTKAKLISPPNKKKYSKQHMILLILIYHFKSVLSINDIGTLFNYFNSEKINIEDIYNNFLKFEDEEKEKIASEFDFKESLQNSKDNLVPIIIKLLIKAEAEKMLAEKLIDEFLTPETPKK